MNSKKKLLDLINSSNLIEEQKSDWQKVVGKLNSQELEIIYSALKDDPDNLDFLTKNLQAKNRNFKTLNKAELDKIIKDEINYLKSKK